MRTTTFISMALLGMVLSAHGQGASRLSAPSATEEQKKKLAQAAERLRQAESDGKLDKARSTAEGLLNKLPANVTGAARSALDNPELKAQAAEAARNLLPEAQKLMNRSPEAETPAAETGLPATAAPTVSDQPPPAAAPEGPKPGSLPPLAQTVATRQPIAVIEADNSVFDPNTNILVYSGHVRARHPQFYIECEELVVHLNKEEADAANAKGAKPVKAAANDPILAKNAKSPEKRNSSVKKAIASGPMVHIEKANEKGEVQRANCRKAVYDGPTGHITMSDNPQVQSGNVMQIAITPDTVMTFDEKGNFTSNRRTRTVILQEEGGQAQPSPTGL